MNRPVAFRTRLCSKWIRMATVLCFALAFEVLFHGVAGNDLVRLSKAPPGGVYEGGDFVLYCEGAKYKTLWYHDAKPISSGKLYKIDGNFNSLLSATASSTSEGIYQCEVNNVRSNECSVRIRRAPEVIFPKEKILVAGHSAEIKFVVKFIGALTVQTTRLSDSTELKEIKRDIDGTENISIPVGNITYGDDNCFFIEIHSLFPETNHTTCLKVKGPPMQPATASAQRVGHDVSVRWSHPIADPTNAEAHEAASKFLVYAKAGRWGKTLDLDLNETEVVISDVPSCVNMTIEVATKGDTLVSEKTLATIISTKPHPKNVTDMKLYCHRNILTVNYNGKELPLSFKTMPINDTVRRLICESLFKNATHTMTKDKEPQLMSGNGCWKADFNDSVTSLAQVLADCPSLVDCGEAYVVKVCSDVYENFCHNKLEEGKRKDGGQSVGLLVGVSLIAVVIVVVSISVFIWWKCKRNGSSMERCSGTSERNPRFQPEDESPQPAPGQVEQIGNHHDHPKPSTVKVARDSNKSLLQNGTCEEVSPGGYDPAQSVSEQADGMQPGTSASSSGGDSVDEANSAGDMYSEENLSAKDNPAERINEWSDEMELEPGSTVMAGASSSGDSEEHLFDEDSPDQRVDERSDEMELGPGPVAMANASRSGGDNSDNSEFNRTVLQELSLVKSGQGEIKDLLRTGFQRLEDEHVETQNISLEEFQKTQELQKDSLALQQQDAAMKADVTVSECGKCTPSETLV